MSEMISTRTGLGNGLLELMEKRGDILVASADTYRSFALGPIVTKYADRYFEFGIAEQNMLTASAAMASDGYTVFCVGYSPFLSMRALEQIRTFCAYTKQHVIIVSGLSGLSGDTDGVTHQGTEDIAIVRSIPNLSVLCPADAVAAKAFAGIAAELEGPAYLRLGRSATPVIYPEDQEFTFGKAIRFREYGKDAVLISAGPCVGECAIAADRLLAQGIRCTVIDMHTIKPLDEETLLDVCCGAQAVITVEDGTIYGGLGGAVAETLLEQGTAPEKFKRMGMTGFGTTGRLPELLHHFGLDADAIEAEVKGLL